MTWKATITSRIKDRDRIANAVAGLVEQLEKVSQREGASVKERDARVAQLESKLLELQTELTQTYRSRAASSEGKLEAQSNAVKYEEEVQAKGEALRAAHALIEERERELIQKDEQLAEVTKEAAQAAETNKQLEVQVEFLQRRLHEKTLAMEEIVAGLSKVQAAEAARLAEITGVLDGARRAAQDEAPLSEVT